MKKQIPWDLLISHLKKDTTEQEEQTLTEWRSSGENESVYQEIVSLWDSILTGSASYHPDTSYYWEQMRARMEAGKTKKTFTLPAHTVRIAAAAVIILFLSVFSSYFITKRYYQPSESVQTYSALNGKSQMRLPDGTTVWLNIGSTLTYKTTFLKDRQVLLDGEALFDVQKDPRHPFVVAAGEVKIHVLGTQFNVEAYAKKESIRVALLNGKISVYALEQMLNMEPGEIVTFDKKTFQLTKAQNDVHFEAFWANNSYTFNAQPLSNICKYLERWYNIRIDLDPAIADSQAYTFTITNEPLETILQIMSRINPIQYSFEEDNRVIITNVSP
ncbi:MAG: DUF4974 domain-containing protein [Tannerellaceae bacterium]|nr:DUF4974 domain-containing protein [Tannerellaceae bacterium]